MQSMMIGDIMSLKQGLDHQSLMLHLFQPNMSNLEHIAVLSLSPEQLMKMKCNTQKMYFYDGLQKKDMNGYLDNANIDDINRYKVMFEYLNKFLQSFEKELTENITDKENNFYDILHSRLCAQYYSMFLPIRW